jgi:hypothetical protein
MNRNYLIAMNKSYENREFYIAKFYQDPETGEVNPVDDIDVITHESFANMTEAEFDAEFEMFRASQQVKQ